MNERSDIRRELCWKNGELKRRKNFQIGIPVSSFIDELMEIYDRRYDFDGGSEGRMYQILYALEGAQAEWDGDDLDPVWQFDSVICPDQRMHYIITNTIYRHTSGEIDLEDAIYEISMGLSRAIEAEVIHKLDTEITRKIQEAAGNDNSC